MPTAYSLELRERVIRAVDVGVSCRRAAAVFQVSTSTVIRWAKHVAETGSCALVPSGGDHRSRDVETHRDWSLPVATAEANLTLEENQGRLEMTHNLAKSQCCL
jgi:transposase